MVAAIAGDWKLNRSLNNLVDGDGEYSATTLANFRLLHTAAEISSEAEPEWQLSLSDAKYVALGADPTGATNSTTAILSLIADCNLYRVVGLVPQGVYWYDPSTTPIIYAGAGLKGVKTNAKVDFDNDYAEDVIGCGSVFKKPYSVNRMVPGIAIHGGGATFVDIVVWYSDVVARLESGAYTIDAESYPTITGEPEDYAPFVITDHVHNDAGTALAAGSGTNCGGSLIDITAIGGKDCVFLGDPDPRDEAWTESGGSRSWSSGLSKGIAGMDVTLRGMWTGRGVHVERSGNTSSITIIATPGFWTEASQMGVIASSDWDSDNPQPLIKYAQRNAVALSAKRKLVGCDIDIKARQMRMMCDFDSGNAMAKTITAVVRGADTTFTVSTPHELKVGSKTWIQGCGGLSGNFNTGAAYEVTAVPTTTSFTITNDTSAMTAWTSGGTASMPCGPQGQDSGKFAALKMSLRGESIPTAMRLSQYAYGARLSITISGHWMDPDDNDNTEPTFDILTHRDRAGRVRKSTGVWASMLTMSPSFGWTNSIRTDPGVQETGGCFFLNTANDGHGFWQFHNEVIHRWGQGDNDLPMIRNLSPDTTIVFNGGLVLGHTQGSKRLFDVPDAVVGDGQILFVRNTNIYGCANANLVLDSGVSLGTEWTGFENCFSDPDRTIAIDDDDDEDSAGGTGSGGGGEPEE
jgi:hypothetical protein